MEANANEDKKMMTGDQVESQASSTDWENQAESEDRPAGREGGRSGDGRRPRGGNRSRRPRPYGDDQEDGDNAEDRGRGGRNRNFHKGKRRNPKGGRREKDDGFKETLVRVNKVAKVVKGGKNYRFAVLMVVGDGKGKVGIGTGKAVEIPDAIRKATDRAKKDLIEVPLDGTTIPHAWTADFGAGRVMMRPAPEGTGVIAGGAVRAVCELCGIKDIVTKSLGSSNPNNMAGAAIECLKNMQTVEEVAVKRGKAISDIR